MPVEFKAELDRIDEFIVKELNCNSFSLINHLPALRIHEEQLSKVHDVVVSASTRITLLSENLAKSEQEFHALTKELDSISQSMKILDSIRQFIISKNTVNVLMEEKDFNCAAKIISSLTKEFDTLSHFDCCRGLIEEVKEISLAVQKLLGNTSKPRLNE